MDSVQTNKNPLHDISLDVVKQVPNRGSEVQNIDKDNNDFSTVRTTI